MIICEYILVGATTFYIMSIGGLILGYCKSLKLMIRQVKKLEDKIAELNEKLTQIQLKVLDLNDLTGLNQPI